MPVRTASVDHMQLFDSVQFGMGPRICTGQVIAMMEMGKVLPQLFRKFDFGLGTDWQTYNHWVVGHRGMIGENQTEGKAYLTYVWEAPK